MVCLFWINSFYEHWMHEFRQHRHIFLDYHKISNRIAPLLSKTWLVHILVRMWKYLLKYYWKSCMNHKMVIIISQKDVWRGQEYWRRRTHQHSGVFICSVLCTMDERQHFIWKWTYHSCVICQGNTLQLDGIDSILLSQLYVQPL